MTANETLQEATAYPTHCDGQMLKALLAAGVGWLAHNREQINRLNVFPVPDGDTGTNMLLTLQRAYREIEASDDTHAGAISRSFAAGALRGARGNSGVILSQLLHGFALSMEEIAAFDVTQLADACANATEYAYRAVIEPVEGTLLTVAREAAAALAESRVNGDLRAALDALTEAAHASLLRTPDLLPALRQAGVIDSGGQGLVHFLNGMQRLLDGEPVVYPEDAPATSDRAASAADFSLPEPDDERGYGYDVQFLMLGESLDVAAIRAQIDSMGWSTLVVGDPSLVKVHVHVHDPGAVISYAIGTGAALDDVVVENMQLQYERNPHHRQSTGDGLSAPSQVAPDAIAVIAVASGAGLQHLLGTEMGAAHIIHGGQTMNPSAEDFLTAIDDLPNPEIILLPNNRNVIMAAQQAAQMAEEAGRQVRVVPTQTVPQAVAAMLAYMDLHGSGDLDATTEAMQEAITHIISGEITTATRSSDLGGVHADEGQVIGLLDGSIVISGDDLETVLLDLLRHAHADERDLITLYYGEALSQAEANRHAEAMRAAFTSSEVHIVDGGQPLYPYLISVE